MVIVSGVERGDWKWNGVEFGETLLSVSVSVDYLRAREHFYNFFFSGKLCVHWTIDCPVCWAVQVLLLDAVMRIH